MAQNGEKRNFRGLVRAGNGPTARAPKTSKVFDGKTARGSAWKSRTETQKCGRKIHNLDLFGAHTQKSGKTYSATNNTPGGRRWGYSDP